MSRRRARRSTAQLKNVHVSPYSRFRFGRMETVCEHYRSSPGQLTFAFYD